MPSATGHSIARRVVRERHEGSLEILMRHASIAPKHRQDGPAPGKSGRTGCSRSTFDLETLLDTLLASAANLCDGHVSYIFQRDGEVLCWGAGYGHAPDVLARLRDYFKTLQVPIDRESVVGRAEGTVVHLPDVLADPGGQRH